MGKNASRRKAKAYEDIVRLRANRRKDCIKCAAALAALASSTNPTASPHWSMAFRVHSISLSCRFVAGRLNAGRVTLTVK